MKNMNNMLLAMTFIVCLMLLTSCTNPPKGVPRARITPQVDLHVVGNPKELKVKTPGSPNCNPATPADHRKGCIVVPSTDTALINFELKTSPDWHFTQIQICNGSAKVGMVCTFAPWQQNEFFATDSAGTIKSWPDTSGVIDLTALPGNLTEFYLFDYNSIAQDYFYTIKVCNPNATPVCIETDPPIANGGRH